MAYNSDGYIMIDFTEVDFRRTNQTIEGLFDRCQKVIGTNKFVIVINANNKTPLPSTVCITNGQYVIESVLYTFAISSNDNLHITKKTTPEELIDDNHITLKTTWSSSKINNELEGKQDTLTAGDNITINNNVISSNVLKSFKYTGDGGGSIWVKLPDDCHYILSIWGRGFEYATQYNISKTDGFCLMDNIINNTRTWIGDENGWANNSAPTRTKYDASQNRLFLQSGTGGIFASNVLDIEYIVYYI